MELSDIATILAIVGGFIAAGTVTLASNRNLRTELKGEMGDLRTELKGEMGDLRTELRAEMGALDARLTGEMATLRTQIKGDITESGAAIVARLDRLEDRVETLDERVYALTLYVAPQMAAVGASGPVPPPAGMTKPPSRRSGTRRSSPPSASSE